LPPGVKAAMPAYVPDPMAGLHNFLNGAVNQAGAILGAVGPGLLDIASGGRPPQVEGQDPGFSLADGGGASVDPGYFQPGAPPPGPIELYKDTRSKGDDKKAAKGKQKSKNKIRDKTSEELMQEIHAIDQELKYRIFDRGQLLEKRDKLYMQWLSTPKTPKGKKNKYDDPDDHKTYIYKDNPKLTRQMAQVQDDIQLVKRDLNSPTLQEWERKLLEKELSRLRTKRKNLPGSAVASAIIDFDENHPVASKIVAPVAAVVGASLLLPETGGALLAGGIALYKKLRSQMAKGSQVTKGASTAGRITQVLLKNGESRIGIIKDGKIVKWSAPNTSHQALAKEAGVFVSKGKLAKGAEAFTVIKEGGKIHVLGSQNFGGVMKISDSAKTVLLEFFK
jgi:hypothetical protein